MYIVCVYMHKYRVLLEAPKLKHELYAGYWHCMNTSYMSVAWERQQNTHTFKTLSKALRDVCIIMYMYMLYTCQCNSN